MNKKYKLIIFDLDGTLADTSEGIYNSHRHATFKMGIRLNENSLDGVIGGELIQIYKDRFGLNDGDARKAVEIYRTRYQEFGIFQAHIYPGMRELLRKLKESGIKLAVATLKREDFAKQILQNMQVAGLFDFILGMDEADTLNKEKLLRKCVELTQDSISESVLIGDSRNDLKGAKACGMDFIGVTYGFGFHTKKEVLNEGAVYCAADIIELDEFLFS